MNKRAHKAKLALFEAAILTGKTSKSMILKGIRDGWTKGTIKYVKKHDRMPDTDYLITEYDDDSTFQQLLSKIDIDREDVLEIANDILGIPTDKVLAMAEDNNPGQAESTKIGRNDPCPCGSGKKYKKCCYLQEV